MGNSSSRAVPEPEGCAKTVGLGRCLGHSCSHNNGKRHSITNPTNPCFPPHPLHPPPRSTDCAGAWVARQPLGIPFYAADNGTLAGTLAVHSFVCSTPINVQFHAYRLATDDPPGDDCTDEGVAFRVPAELDSGVVIMYELTSATDGDFFYSTSNDPFPGYVATGHSFYAYSNEEPVDGSVPLFGSYISVLNSTGLVTDYMLSTDGAAGKTCAYWDTTVPNTTLTAQLNDTKNTCLKNMRALEGLNPITNPDTLLRVAIGGGIDGSTGVMTHSPIVHLDYGNPGDQFCPSNPNGTCLTVPGGVEVASVVSPTAIDSTEVFATISEFVQHSVDAIAQSQGVVGTYYEMPWLDVMNSIFNDPSDVGLSITQGRYTILTASFSSPSTLELDPDFLDALNQAPPDYATSVNKEVWWKIYQVEWRFRVKSGRGKGASFLSPRLAAVSWLLAYHAADP